MKFLRAFYAWVSEWWPLHMAFWGLIALTLYCFGFVIWESSDTLLEIFRALISAHSESMDYLLH